jgi:hypothetical protein
MTPKTARTFRHDLEAAKLPYKTPEGWRTSTGKGNNGTLILRMLVVQRR